MLSIRGVGVSEVKDQCAGSLLPVDLANDLVHIDSLVTHFLIRLAMRNRPTISRQAIA